MTDVKLPNGWAVATLEEVCEVVAGNPAPQGKEYFENGKFNFVRVQDMGRLGNAIYLSEVKDKINERATQKLKLFPKGSVLFTKSGASTLNNQRAILGKDSYVVSHIAASIPEQGVSSEWIYFSLLCVDFADLAHSSVMPSLPLSKVKPIQVLLPPAKEQTRIVAKLEELLSDLDIGVAELKAAQKKLAQYRQSLLKAAIEGELTAEWRANNTPTETGAELLERILTERRARWEAKQLAKFAEQGKKPPKDWQKKYPEPVKPDTSDLPQLPEGWVWASLDMLGEIASGVAKGTKRKDSIEVREVPYLRVANVQRGYLDLSEVKTILATEKDIKELTLQAGDVLFNEGGDRDKLGRGWVWRNEVENCIHQNHVFRMRPFLSEVLPELISHHGNTFGKTWFQHAGKQTTNLASINMTMLRMFPVPLGPADEQRELLTQLDRQIEQLDR